MSRHKPVLTKQDFVRRYAAGEFGNMPPTWQTLEEYLRSGYVGLIHIRNRTKGGQTWYNVPHTEVENLWNKLIKTAAENGVSPKTLYISGMGPEDKKIFQGEVQRGLWGLDLHYNLEALPMRLVSPKDWYNTRGLTANLLIDSYMCQRSNQWLEYLLEEYPGHVIEFSTYSMQWGNVPGYNTVFWEVRNY